jgi:hypothetical protein
MRKMSIAAATVGLVSAAAMIATPALAADHHHKHVHHTKSVSGNYEFYNQDIAGDHYSVKASQSFSLRINRANPASHVKRHDVNVTVKTSPQLAVTVKTSKPDVSVEKCKLVDGKKCTRVVVDLTGKAVTQFGTVYHQSGHLITEVSQSGHSATWGSMGPITKDA